MDTEVGAVGDRVRDRIVILGRRRAGKTVYLSRLYEQLWEGRDGVMARAGDGAMHERCMEICEELAQGKWPAATAGSIFSRLEVTVDQKRIELVALDYPGEVFRRALVENAQDDQSMSLLKHIDRAAAVLLLIDPGNLETGSTAARVDDDYGMVQAIDRIRRSEGGHRVPVAVVFTKCDEHVQLIRDTGTPREFAQERIPNLFRYGGDVRVFAASAVRTRRDAIGRAVPHIERPPRGIIEPLRYCLGGVQPDVLVAPPSAQSAAMPEQWARRIAHPKPRVPVWVIVVGCVAVTFFVVAISSLVIWAR